MIKEYIEEIQKAFTYLEHLKFDKEHPWHRNLIALYCSLIEYSDSLVFLIQNKKNICIPIVFRSLLEAFVDFKNLAEDKTYGYHMEASYNKEWLKIIEEASKNQNSFLDSLSADPEIDLKEEIKKHKASLDEYKRNKYPPLNHFQKFERAGMEEEYRSIYNFMCSHSHNNIRSFISRFIEINTEKKDFQIALFKEKDPSEYEIYLTTGRHYLRLGNYNIHAILESGMEVNFQGKPGTLPSFPS